MGYAHPWPWPLATLREWPRFLRCEQPMRYAHATRTANGLRAPLALAVGHATRMATLLEVRTAISYQPKANG
ncbi:hypothetical protein BJP36_38205 [Moorena producens JHB]|uniref:Uncharacterized protein n=1 Tax=Moorena producens (strain JHB) TaxID=1454205 RepID=A0A9Q9SUK8_MOOP1|nr:hypothetical protein [Moorena producens]WAN69925.1 hypothetical protein BJP36_38205 [Moorena producens JHB]